MHWVTINPLGSMKLPQHIRGSITDKNNDYLLEIANHCHADSELLALCALAPAIREFLEMFDSPVAELLLQTWRKKTADIYDEQRQPDTPPKVTTG
jgi:hypothetical protein